MTEKTVIVGCGYVGKRLRRRADHAAALGVSRTRPEGAEHWLALDLDADPLAPLVESIAGSLLYYFAPPSMTSERDDRSRRLLEALADAGAAPRAVVLISTTGVYGDCGGDWVDERRALQPGSARSRRRADAEAAWTAFCETRGVPLARLRVAGIYGPGKLPLARLAGEQPLLRQSQSPYSNRVHVDDLLDCAVAAAGGEWLLNVADGTPSSMTAYFHALADAVGVARLPEADREALAQRWSAGLRSYMEESRRIDNGAMRALLGGRLRYPALGPGLAACLAETDAAETDAED